MSPARSASSRSPPGSGHGGQPHVVVDVEVGVVHPDRVAQAERHLDQPAPEDRGAGDAGGDRLLHPLEGVAARDGRRVEDQGHGHVHVEARGLEVEEAGVEPAESFHAPPFRCVVPPVLRPISRAPVASLRRPDRVYGGVAWVFLAVSIGLRRPRGQRLLPGAAGAVHRGQLRPRAGSPASCRSRSAWSRWPARWPSPSTAPSTAGPAGWAWPSGRGLVAGLRPAGRGRPPGRGPGRRGPRRGHRGAGRRRDGFDPTPAWNHWWRLVIAVPFRLRGIRRVRNIDYWGDGNYRHKLDILEPPVGRPERAPVLVYIHGGAWMIGDKRQQGIPMMHELVQRGWVCVAINYRLSPRATWPAHIVDCKRAVAWVREHIAEYGGDPELHRRLRRVGRGPPLVAAGPHPERARVAARLRGPGHLGRRLRPLLRRLRHDRRPGAVGGLRARARSTSSSAG